MPRCRRPHVRTPRLRCAQAAARQGRGRGDDGTLGFRPGHPLGGDGGQEFMLYIVLYILVIRHCEQWRHLKVNRKSLLSC